MNYSTITAPPTSLLKRESKYLSWSTEATQSFQLFKQAFNMAPLLTHPDPDKPVVVKVEALATGVEGEAFPSPSMRLFLWKTYPSGAELWYQELWVVGHKIALEEWIHWLEEARHPFTVLVDHRNLEYLRDAKWLNPQQAIWVLFFNFVVSYRPGSKDNKADALSRFYASDKIPEDPKPILPSNIIVSQILWSLDERIAEATATEPAPPGYPVLMFPIYTDFLISSQRTVQWALATLGPIRPSRYYKKISGGQRWHRMTKALFKVVRSVPRQRPSGKLLLLPVPFRPWSHLGVDFIFDSPAFPQ